MPYAVKADRLAELRQFAKFLQRYYHCCNEAESPERARILKFKQSKQQLPWS
jgi:hypothetical protein